MAIVLVLVLDCYDGCSSVFNLAAILRTTYFHIHSLRLQGLGHQTDWGSVGIYG
jgi:hypothetical protein